MKKTSEQSVLVTSWRLKHPTHAPKGVFDIPEKKKEIAMKKMLRTLMLMCLLAAPLATFAQSGDNMKQDQSQDQMKQDQMKHDDNMKKDEMKNDSKASKKKAKTKKDNMKHDDNMKNDDNMKKDDGMKQN
jgi:pentapeptide MXKDX repeat protein